MYDLQSNAAEYVVKIIAKINRRCFETIGIYHRCLKGKFLFIYLFFSYIFNRYNSKVFDIFFQLLTLHYERCAKYYGSTGGQGLYGASSDEEKRLTMMLFSNIFDSLSQMVS